jgi:hypothetical protein
MQSPRQRQKRTSQRRPSHPRVIHPPPWRGSRAPLLGSQQSSSLTPNQTMEVTMLNDAVVRRILRSTSTLANAAVLHESRWTEARDKLARALAQSTNTQALALGARLDACSAHEPCASPACTHCLIKFQTWYFGELRSLELPGAITLVSSSQIRDGNPPAGQYNLAQLMAGIASLLQRVDLHVYPASCLLRLSQKDWLSAGQQYDYVLVVGTSPIRVQEPLTPMFSGSPIHRWEVTTRPLAAITVCEFEKRWINSLQRAASEVAVTPSSLKFAQRVGQYSLGAFFSAQGLQTTKTVSLRKTWAA